MRAHYESWLATTKQIAGRPNHIVVGTSNESPTVLTAADWIGPYCGEWGELKESAQPKFGAWDIEAGVTGNYEIQLYFFPQNPAGGSTNHSGPHRRARWRAPACGSTTGN